MEANGEVVIVYPSHLKVPCVTDLTLWPYDVHNCSAKYGSWVHDGYSIDLELQDDTPEVEVHSLTCHFNPSIILNNIILYVTFQLVIGHWYYS